MMKSRGEEREKKNTILEFFFPGPKALAVGDRKSSSDITCEALEKPDQTIK